MPDIHVIVLALLRWIHIFAGIAWIGHLYFFNFVNAHFEKTVDAAAKKSVIPNLRGRALWWFRMGAMVTFLAGVTWMIWNIFISSNKGFAYFNNERGMFISFGMLLGTIMWFNVWFIIWPRQKKIITGITTGNKPPDFDALVAMAGKASRLNTYLSVPMLFGMVAGAEHFGVNGVGLAGGLIAGVFVVGFGISYVLVNKVGAKVGTEFVPPAPPTAPAAPPPAPAAPPPAPK